MKIKAVLFDIDGTLLDTTELIHQAYEYTIPFYGFNTPQRKKVASLIGKSLEEIYSVLAPTGDFKKLYTTHTNFQIKNVHLAALYKHTLEVLEKLKKRKIKIAAVTSRSRKSLMPSLKQTKIDKLFDAIISADDVKNTKPHPEAVLKVLKKLKVSKEEALVVGDAKYDIESGKAAGVKTVGVTYGFGKAEIKGAKPDFLIDNLSELPGILA